MSIFEKAKMAYDSIEVPRELEDTVNRTILDSNVVQKRNAVKQNRVIKGNKVFKNATRTNRPLIVFRSFTLALIATFALFVVLLNTNESFAKAMQDIPAIAGIAKVFTVREYKEENETDLIDVKVPAIQNTGNSDLENRINYEISSKINDVIEEARTRAEEYKNAVLATGGTMDDYIPTRINIDYKITYQDDNFISFVITKSESQASAYQEQYFYNIDIQNGKELNLKDVLGADYKQIVDESVEKQINERMESNSNNMYFTKEEGGFSEIENEYQDFYINENKKAVIVFQKYEIAPGYMGIQNFEIPNELII